MEMEVCASFGMSEIVSAIRANTHTHTQTDAHSLQHYNKFVGNAYEISSFSILPCPFLLSSSDFAFYGTFRPCFDLQSQGIFLDYSVLFRLAMQAAGAAFNILTALNE